MSTASVRMVKTVEFEVCIDLESLKEELGVPPLAEDVRDAAHDIWADLVAAGIERVQRESTVCATNILATYTNHEEVIKNG